MFCFPNTNTERERAPGRSLGDFGEDGGGTDHLKNLRSKEYAQLIREGTNGGSMEQDAPGLMTGTPNMCLPSSHPKALILQVPVFSSKYARDMEFLCPPVHRDHFEKVSG